MAETTHAAAAGAASADVAGNLAHAAPPPAELNASLEEHGAPHAEGHVDPTALGLNATAWVALAMIFVIALMLWKKVPALIGAALDRKIATIREQLDEAKRLRAEAEALRAEYEGKSAAAASEALARRASQLLELVIDVGAVQAELRRKLVGPCAQL